VEADNRFVPVVNDAFERHAGGIGIMDGRVTYAEKPKTVPARPS